MCINLPFFQIVKLTCVHVCNIQSFYAQTCGQGDCPQMTMTKPTKIQTTQNVICFSKHTVHLGKSAKCEFF